MKDTDRCDFWCQIGAGLMVLLVLLALPWIFWLFTKYINWCISIQCG